MMINKEIAKKVLPYRVVMAIESIRRKESHINRALGALDGHTYVEIGVRSGTCFRQIAAPRKIGIDPAPMDLSHKIASGESFFQMTSDDFFANHAEQMFCSQRVDVALVDGLHEFSQALQDVLHLERYMSDRGAIFLHDCNPASRKDTEFKEGIWNGDVWKVAYYLTTYRHDLSFFTLNCDFGLGVITGFRSSSDSEPPSPKILET